MKSALVRLGVVATIVIGAPGIAGAWGSDNDGRDRPGRCTGVPFKVVRISALTGGERARAEKVNRNGNDFVCRKDIPGRGRGNTGENSNIKDDKI
jgi:hypothetical protein